MKRFRFSLDAVRDLRSDREDAAKRVLAERLRAHQAARDAADQSLARHGAAEDALRGATSTTAAGLVQADRDRTAARVGLEQSARALEERGHGVLRAREDLLVARTALEAVRRLEQRRRDEHASELRRADERERQDLIEARAARKQFLERRAEARRRSAA